MGINFTQAKLRAVSILTVLLGLSLCAAAGFAGVAEFGGKLPAGQSLSARAEALTRDGVWPGMSFASSWQTLRDCHELMDSAYALTRPTSERFGIVRACMDLAVANTRLTPTSSYAWLVRAIAAAGLKDLADFNAAMRMSQLSGAYEGWISQMRVDQVERHFALADDTVVQGHKADLAMLVSSVAGITSIARRYLMQPDFRERILSVVETLPQPDQQRFVGIVSALAYGT